MDADARTKNEKNQATYTYWKNQIDQAEKDLKTFSEKGTKIIKRYRDDDRVGDGARRYNILYSNTETLQPVIYSDKPKPDIRARDTKNIVARKAAEMIEKALNYYLTCGDFDDIARLTTTDFLLPGLGQMRPKYKPTIEEYEEEISITDALPGEDVKETGEGIFTRKSERVIYEEIKFEYVHWKNYIYPQSVSHADLPWMAIKSFYTYEEAVEEFDREIANKLKYEPYKPEDSLDLDQMKSEGVKKAVVYEIWDKHYRQQVFFSENRDSAVIEINDDPLELEEFFPVPKPMLSIITSGSMIPIPFFIMYQDQAIELDDLNARICAMINYMRRRGFYDKSIDALVNLSNMGDNEYYPVDNWSEFVGKGGLSGVMQTEDISSYAAILEILITARQQLLEDIFQIIGISDIRRGQTDPRETLGAQQMKGRYGTIRISTYQRKSSEFFRDLLRIAGEIIINQFDPETIALITNMPLETTTERDDKGELKVIEVGVRDLLDDLRSKSPSSIIIDIQTDSTILEDSEGDKADLVALTSALAEFTGIAPQMIEVIGLDATAGLLMSIVQKFKLGRDVQQAVADYIDEVKEKQKEAEGQPPKKTPEETIAEAEVMKKKMEIDFEGQKLMVDSKIKMAEIGVKQQTNFLKAQELGIYNNLESQKIDLKAIDGFLKAEGLKIEAANSKDNAVAGA